MSEYSKKPKPGVVKEVAASDFKNAWYEYLDLVHQGHEEIVVTRYGKPIAKVIPFTGGEGNQSLFGMLSGSVTICGDIVGPIEVQWEVDA